MEPSTHSDDPRLRVRRDYAITATPWGEERTLKNSCTDFAWSLTGYTNTPALNGSYRTMADYVVSRFNKRRAAGEVFFHNMSREEVTISTVGGPYQYRATTNCGATSNKASWRSTGAPHVLGMLPLQAANGNGHKLPVISSSLSDSEILRVQRLVSTEVLSKRGTADSDLWESLAEYRRTIEMLNDPLRRLKDLTSRLVTSTERSSLSRQLVREVSSGYLMKRYGIEPLMRDIKNILSSLEKLGGHRRKTTRAQEQLFAESVITGTTSDGFWNPTWSNQIRETCTVRAMSLDEGYVSLANNLGLTFKGLAMLPLQLTSYSFVADWFTNLGSYVQAGIPAFGWNQLGSCMVTTRVTSNAYALTGSGTLPAPYVKDAGPNGTCGIVRVSTTRTPLLPASFERVSDFKFDTFTRAADAIALVASRMTKMQALVGPHRSLAFPEHRERAYRRWADTLNYSRQFT